MTFLWESLLVIFCTGKLLALSLAILSSSSLCSLSLPPSIAYFLPLFFTFFFFSLLSPLTFVSRNSIAVVQNLEALQRELTESVLRSLIEWLMGWPAGFKLNENLDRFLGRLFLYYIEVSNTGHITPTHHLSSLGPQYLPNVINHQSSSIIIKFLLMAVLMLIIPEMDHRYRCAVLARWRRGYTPCLSVWHVWHQCHDQPGVGLGCFPYCPHCILILLYIRGSSGESFDHL